MIVRFYSNFSKRKNSTKIPTGTYTSKTVRWKENTSIHNPVVELAGTPTVAYTYCYIQSWGKYYYVEDIVTVANGVTEYHLKEDRLASNKSAILASSARVAFSTNLHYTNVVDPRITVMTSHKEKQSTSTNIIDASLTGCYVLTVMSKDGGPTGIGDVYYLNKANMQEFAKCLCDTSFTQSIVNLFHGKLQDAILNVRWIPFSPPASGDNWVTSVSKITVGDTTTDQYGYTVNALRANTYHVADIAVSLAIHKTYPKTDFRATEPYTSGFLYLPGVGIVQLSMSDLIEGDTVDIDVAEDYVTGDIHYAIKNANGDIIQTVKANMAAECPLGSIEVNGAGVTNGIKTGIIGAVGFLSGSGAIAAAGAGAMLSGAASAALSANQRSASITGSITGRYQDDYRIIYTEFAVDTQDPEDLGYLNLKGRPYGEVVTLSSCTGFVQCDGAQVDIAGSEEERDEINALLNEGIYIE